MLYLNPLLNTLAYLNGERSASSATTAARTDFLQKTLEECYQAYPWRFARATATLSISSGIATLPTNFDVAHRVKASYFSGDDEIGLEQIDQPDKADYVDGDRKFWLTSVSSASGVRYILNTKESSPTQVVVVHQTLPPTIAASTGTPYPNAMTLALGARRFVKLGQNPDADISQDQAIFQQYLDNDKAAEQIPSPTRTIRTIQDITGRHTGDI